MSTDEYRSPEYEEWLSEQACHGVFMGGYTFEEEAGAWAAWQASRAAIVIELPKRADTGVDTGGWPIDSGSHRINCVLAQCRKAIKAAGLRVSQP